MRKNDARFKVLTAASMKIRPFYNAAPCSLVGADRRFRGSYRPHHQGDVIHCPDDGGSTPLWNVGSTPTKLHGATSQKTLIFMLKNYFSKAYKRALFISKAIRRAGKGATAYLYAVT
jgi:hypothetical protein